MSTSFDMYMPMSTTKRHNNIISFLIGKVLHLIEKKEIHAWHEECALVHYGSKKSLGFELVDVKSIDNVEHFLEDVIIELDYVNPDFVLFAKNPYIENKKRTRTAGQPDLIVEVWSESNTKNDRAFIQNLYGTSPVTEHWYIEQDSNTVQCYIGEKKLSDQYLTNVLVTINGIEFDLRYLAI